MQNKINRKKVFIGVFAGMLTIPMLTYPIAQRYVDTENYESRELAVRPDLAVTPLGEYPDAYEAYFNDHLPYKNQLQFVNKATDLLLFNNLESDLVLLGKNQWLFYKADECILDYIGARVYSDAELEEIKNNLLYAEEWFGARNIQMIINIVPNKDEVYSEYMPDEYRVINSVSMSEQAVEYLKNNTSVNVFYELETLKEASKEIQTYCKYDTHWNFIGGYYGTKAVLEAAGREMVSCTGKDIVPWSQEVFPVAPQQIGKTYDLAMMVGLPHLLDSDRDAKYMVNYRPDVKFEYHTLESYSDIDTMVYKSDAVDNRNVMMICDSFGNLNMPYIAKEFANSSCIHYNHYTKGFIETQQPDIVIFQFVERQSHRFDQQIMNIINIEDGE